VEADGHLPAHLAGGPRVQAAIVEGQVPGQGGSDEDPGLDPDHRTRDQIDRARLVEVGAAVRTARQLGLKLEDPAGRHVQADAPLERVSNLQAVGVAVDLVTERRVNVGCAVQVFDRITSAPRRLAGSQALRLIGGGSLTYLRAPAPAVVLVEQLVLAPSCTSPTPVCQWGFLSRFPRRKVVEEGCLRARSRSNPALNRRR
jgi:hypothetical protein